jgi:hypothetical protein
VIAAALVGRAAASGGESFPISTARVGVSHAVSEHAAKATSGMTLMLIPWTKMLLLQQKTYVLPARAGHESARP